MARVARKVDDRQVLTLIRRYLDAGIMVDGIQQPSDQGTPQGSQLSPLGSVTEMIERRLKLKVNQDKSSVRHARSATLLGFGFFFTRDGVKIRVAAQAVTRLKMRLRELTKRSWGVSMQHRIDTLNRFTTGWMAYFRLSDTPKVFRELDKWFYRRMGQIRWKEWKRYTTRRRNLSAWASRRCQRCDGRALAKAIGASRDHPSSNARCPKPTGPTLASTIYHKHGAGSDRLNEPPDAVPHVRWCGRGPGDPDPYPITASGRGPRGR